LWIIFKKFNWANLSNFTLSFDEKNWLLWNKIVIFIKIKCNNWWTLLTLALYSIVSWHKGNTTFLMKYIYYQSLYDLWSCQNSQEWEYYEGGRVREMLIELLRSWQLPRKQREEFFHWKSWLGVGGGEGGRHWAGLPLLVHRALWKFIFLIGHISFRIRVDSMLKIIRNFINPNRLTVWVSGT
jgi:hypothetical protein